MPPHCLRRKKEGPEHPSPQQDKSQRKRGAMVSGSSPRSTQARCHPGCTRAAQLAARPTPLRLVCGDKEIKGHFLSSPESCLEKNKIKINILPLGWSTGTQRHKCRGGTSSLPREMLQPRASFYLSWYFLSKNSSIPLGSKRFVLAEAGCSQATAPSVALVLGDAVLGGRERSQQTLDYNRKILEINWSRNSGCPGCATGSSCACLTRYTLRGDNAKPAVLSASISEPTLPEHCKEGWINRHPLPSEIPDCHQVLATAGTSHTTASPATP